MKASLLVSVIIPTFNRSEKVVRAVKSVLNQSYVNLECIVIDDSSTDDTVDQLYAVKATDHRLIIIVHDNNQHASAARNTGISAASGSLIAFLDDDDVWLESKLLNQVDVISRASDDVGLVYCWYDIFDGHDKVGSRKPELEGNLFDELLVGQPLGNASTLLVKNQVIKKSGGFDINLPRGNDGDFIRRVTKYYKVAVVKEVLVHYHIENVELSPRISLLDHKGLLDDIKSIEVKLEKFSQDFLDRPTLHFVVLRTLLQRYVVAQQYRSALKVIRMAVFLSKDKSKYYSLTIALIRALITLGGRCVRRIGKYFNG